MDVVTFAALIMRSGKYCGIPILWHPNMTSTSWMPNDSLNANVSYSEYVIPAHISVREL